MPPTPEIQRRVDALKEQLDEEIVHSWEKAKRNHLANLILMIIALAASVIAGLGGITNALSAQTTGAVALLPGLMALVAVTMKFQGKAGWHYRKRDALKNLKSRLCFELPESPSADNVAAIAKEKRELTIAMQDEWERDLTLSWAGFQQPKNQEQVTQHPSLRPARESEDVVTAASKQP
jgi:hypothetical protein